MIVQVIFPPNRYYLEENVGSVPKGKPFTIKNVYHGRVYIEYENEDGRSDVLSLFEFQLFANKIKQ